MSDPVIYIYIYIYIYDLQVNSLLVTLFLNKPELICFYTVKWFQILISNTNSSICRVKWFQVLLFIIFTQLNSFKNC